MAKVLITGASAGLGAELAKAFAARGDTLVLAARRLARLEAMKPELLALGAPEVVCYPVDLAEPAEVSQLAEALPGLALDVLINNAALGHWDALWDTPLETLNHMIAINMQALAHLTTAFSAYGKDRPTRLMNVASGAGYALFEGALLATLKALPDSAPIVGIDASNVERLYTPIAQILCSAIKSDLPISIVSPSEEFIEACNDLGIWAHV